MYERLTINLVFNIDKLLMKRAINILLYMGTGWLSFRIRYQVPNIAPECRQSCKNI